jgi:hypothetical protein
MATAVLMALGEESDAAVDAVEATVSHVETPSQRRSDIAVDDVCRLIISGSTRELRSLRAGLAT